MALTCRWDKVKFFSDSNICIDCINDAQVEDLWQIYGPLNRSDLHATWFMHIGISLNVKAHLLAKGNLILERDFMHFTVDVIAYSNYE